MMTEMKNELLENIKKSMLSVEKEVSSMKNELTNIKNLGQASESEQKLLEQKIIHTEQIVNTFKEQWSTQLESQKGSLNVMVQQTVQE